VDFLTIFGKYTNIICQAQNAPSEPNVIAFCYYGINQQAGRRE